GAGWAAPGRREPGQFLPIVCSTRPGGGASTSTMPLSPPALMICDPSGFMLLEPMIGGSPSPTITVCPPSLEMTTLHGGASDTGTDCQPSAFSLAAMSDTLSLCQSIQPAFSRQAVTKLAQHTFVGTLFIGSSPLAMSCAADLPMTLSAIAAGLSPVTLTLPGVPPPGATPDAA